MGFIDLGQLPPTNRMVHIVSRSELLETRLGDDPMAGSTPEGRAAAARQRQARLEAQAPLENRLADTAPLVEPVEAINGQLFDAEVTLVTDEPASAEVPPIELADN